MKKLTAKCPIYEDLDGGSYSVIHSIINNQWYFINFSSSRHTCGVMHRALDPYDNGVDPTYPNIDRSKILYYFDLYDHPELLI